MKTHLLFWLKQTALLFFFWLALFFIQRLIFVGVYHSLFSKVPFVDLLGVFFHGFRLDISTVGYLLSPLFLFTLCFSFLSKATLQKFVFTLLWVEVFIIILVHVGELGVYDEWRHKLSSRVFMHLSNTNEITRTSGYAALFFAVFTFLLELCAAILLFKRINKANPIPVNEISQIKRAGTLSAFSFVCLPLSVILMRGGLQQIPINIDAAYFSSHIVANDAAINSAYYFGNSYFLFKKSDLPNHVAQSLSPAEKNKANAFYAFYPSDVKLFENSINPNVVFIIFEGWSANAMGCLSSGKTATPFFDKMAETGVLFTDIYAANTTSEIGNAAILSGFTGLPETPLTLYPEKHRKINALSDVFSKRGYHTSYLFSGDLMYGNIKGFLTEHRFKRLQDEKDFDQKLPKGKLNFYDEALFDKFLGELKNNSKPFFSCVFTGSTHFPYDGPIRFKDFSGEDADYLNALRYADHCLASFFEKAAREPWYKNTVFVLVSDHGHNTPKASYPQDLKSYRIPLLMYSALIKPAFRGKKIYKPGSQADIATTLLDQLSWPTDSFPFSRNLLSNRTKGGAFLSTIRGYGIVDELGGFLYHFDQKKTTSNTYKSATEYNEGSSLAKACLFTLFQYFQAL